MRRTTAFLLCMFTIFSLRLPVAAAELVPVGAAVGLELTADGIYVVDFDESSPARAAGLRQGDLLTAVDGRPLTCLEDLTDAIRSCGGKPLVLSLRRNESTATVSVTPERKAGGWRLGMYVKDKIAGIGTVTFYDPETGLFATLGHGVSEGTSGALFTLRGGTARAVRITSVDRGKAGDPGSLHGAVISGETIGTVTDNTACGVFGQAGDAPWTGRPIPVAAPSEIRTGAAQILSTVDGTGVCPYTVQILEIHPGDRLHRNLLLQVTDPDLLEKTGGIVQGMSGSPILQDGKLVGAVTHVLISDPARGYGILAEEMLGAVAAAPLHLVLLSKKVETKRQNVVVFSLNILRDYAIL